MPARLAVAAVALAVCFTPAAVRAGEHWGYGKEHAGPAHWSELDPGFAACGVGKLQSPIDVAGAKKADLPAIEFGWKPGALELVNNGHTIQGVPPPGSTITVGGRVYELTQFHFHAPSEEAIAGKRSAMVGHFVHKDADGELAVVAVLFDLGGENAALAPLFAKLPARSGADVALGAPFDPSALLPAKRGYYAFEGSLTTPPCSEGVHWLVLRQHDTLSKAQLAAFKHLYPANARPLQPRNGREIHVSM
jgi:carbonic anhydrase